MHRGLSPTDKENKKQEQQSWIVDNTHTEEGACGRYQKRKSKVRHELLLIRTQKRAPAAGIKKEKQGSSWFFHNTHPEEGACGRYQKNNKWTVWVAICVLNITTRNKSLAAAPENNTVWQVEVCHYLFTILTRDNGTCGRNKEKDTCETY